MYYWEQCAIIFPLLIMQPSVSGMEPPFGDAFQNYSFVDQALTSTELLATSSDPDFMYELVSSRLSCPHMDQYVKTVLRLCLFYAFFIVSKEVACHSSQWKSYKTIAASFKCKNDFSFRFQPQLLCKNSDFPSGLILYSTSRVIWSFTFTLVNKHGFWARNTELLRYALSGLMLNIW